MMIDSFKGTCKLKSTHHIFNKEDGRGCQDFQNPTPQKK